MFGESLRGPGMIVLQAVRVITIISLLAGTVGCWTLMIKVKVSDAWFFFSAVSLFCTSVAAVFLAISELPLLPSLQAYFRRTWPVLSDYHGLTWLGVALMLIGSNILGKLNHPANSQKNLGLAFWQLVVASGILCIISGVFNILLSLIFWDRSNGINARIVRAEGRLAKAPDADFSKSGSSYNGSFKEEKPRATFMSFFWKKGDNDNGKPTSSRPNISHPMPREHDVERNAPPHYENHHASDDEDWEQDRRSPIVPEIRRPDTALHPMHTGRSSLYSAAHMSRF
ncbi:hypothetical protein FDECE_10794 [Fusarium decemcellulare]|nr:hypothetical protein FDECE_10794 [Fusarium decemcellulare]